MRPTGDNGTASYEDVGLEIQGTMTFDEWRELLAGLGAMSRSHQWWVGDALVWGEARFGEEAATGADALGLEPHTMLNYRWVASAIAPARRRKELSWSHHAEVARLEPRDQEHMLARAIAEELTIRDLRVIVAIEYPQRGQLQLGGGDDGDGAGQGDEAERFFRKRLEDIADRWEQLRALEPEDIEWLLHELRRRAFAGAAA